MRRTLFAVFILILWAACAIFFTDLFAFSKSISVLVAYALIFIGCVGAWLSFPEGLSRAQQFVLILVVSIVARLLLMPMSVSDDVNRYLWEGKQILEGISPYDYPANDPRYEDLRDAYWEGVNHKDRLTAYPPLVELIFAASVYLFYDPFVFKIIFTLFDIGVILLLFALFKQKSLHPRAILLYSLNPIVLFAVSGEAHFDILSVFFVLLSISSLERKQHALAWLWLGVAIQIKVIALILIPYYLFQSRCSRLWVIIFPIVLPSLYFAGSLDGFIEGLTAFGGSNSFNSPVHTFIYRFTSDIDLATTVVLCLLAIVYIGVLRSRLSPTRAAFFLFGALVVLMPIVHFWYLLWVLPFFALSPCLSWLVLSLSTMNYFMTQYTLEVSGVWGLPDWALILTWLPFLIILIYESRVIVRRKFSLGANFSNPESLSVIIPTINEEGRIRGCVESLRNQSKSVDEIIICDGGSEDSTFEIASELGCKVLRTEKGRGNQIKAGVDYASSDAVLVMHADCVCSDNVAKRILELLRNNPGVVGGSLGQRFDPPSAVLLIIEMLNDARATLGGCSFGDQGQFFRREFLNAYGGFPNYPLMEDVELGLRMLSSGRVVLLGENLKVSPRQWVADSFLRRVFMIIRLVAIYRMNRLLGRNITHKLHKEYYS